MTEAAGPSPTEYRRARVRELGDIPLDTVDFLDAMSALTSLQLGVYMRLRTSLYLRGALPVGLKALAAIAQVTPRTFEKMAPALWPLFDHDGIEDLGGRWRDHELEARRAGLAAPPLTMAERTVDPDLSAKRSAAGKRGKEEQLKRRRESLRLIEGGGQVPDALAKVLANDQANRLANGLANEGGDARSLPDSSSVFASGLPSGAPGPSDGLSSEESKEKIEETDGRTDAPSAGNSGKPAGKIAGADGGEPDETAGKPLANEGADPAGKLANEPLANERPSDGAIIAALRKAGGAKIPAALLTTRGVDPIRALLAEGCDLARDVVPAVEATVPGLQAPLRSLRAGFLRDAALANRDLAVALGASKTEGFRHFFIKPGMPEWEAWLKHENRKSFPLIATGPSRRFDDKGYYVPSRWPPGMDPQR